MSKTLVLKPRLISSDGQPSWHDNFLLSNALATIAKNKSLSEMSLWISVAGKIREATDDAELGKKIEIKTDGSDKPVFGQHLPVISVNIKNSEASHLWKELSKLKFEDFGSPLQCRKCGSSVANVPDVGTLFIMLSEIAKSFGENMPEADDDLDDPEKEIPE